MCFIDSKTSSELEHVLLTTLYLAGAKNTDSWHARKGDFQCTFPLDVQMVPSSTLTIATDDKRLACGGFYLSETAHLGSFEFTTDYFNGMSLSLRRSNTGVTFIGSTHSGSPSPWQAMIEDTIEEFHIASSREGGSGLPSPRRHDTAALPAPVTLTPCMENAPTTQAMTMVPPWTAEPRLDTGLPIER
jgi:hypothetical protein